MKNKFDGEEYFDNLKADARKILKDVKKELADDTKNKLKSKEGDKK